VVWTGWGGPIDANTFMSLRPGVQLTVTTVASVSSGLSKTMETPTPAATSSSYFADVDLTFDDEDSVYTSVAATATASPLPPLTKDLITQVEALGFTAIEAYNAISRCSSVEAAVDWILANPGECVCGLFELSVLVWAECSASYACVGHVTASVADIASSAASSKKRPKNSGS
jgi:hypothetical protein